MISHDTSASTNNGDTHLDVRKMLSSDDPEYVPLIAVELRHDEAERNVQINELYKSKYIKNNYSQVLDISPVSISIIIRRYL